MSSLSAARAREASEQSKAQILATRRRNALAQRRITANRETEHQVWWEGEVRKDYEEGLAKAIKVGNRSFRVDISSSRSISNVKEFLAQHNDTPLLKKIWRNLRTRKFKVEVLMKSDHFSGMSMYEGVPDEDPYTVYHYTAKVSW